MRSSRARRSARIFGLALAALAIAVPTASAHKRHGHGHGHGHHHKHKKQDAKLQLLSFNDFHGNLEPPTGSGGVVRIGTNPDGTAQTVPAGGVEYLATHIRALERRAKNSFVVGAGDMIGASPLISALFHDEPTIEAMNKIGLDMTSVGNHEFDEGEQELKRMQYGGCGPENSCVDGRFKGAKFPFLAANVVRKDTGRPLFAPYAIRKVDGVKVGFIGMTLEGTPQIVAPAGISNLNFLDEADTANKYARELRRNHGVKAIVVLLHEGGAQNPLTSSINSCVGFSGPIVDIVGRTTDEVDLFVTGHSHQPYNCVIDGRPVTSAFSFGRLVTDIDMTLGRRSHDVKTISVNNKIVTRDVDRAPDLAQLVSKYKQLAAPIAGEIVGRASETIDREADDSRENPLGNLIADAQLADTTAADRGDADVALMNPGGVRADLEAGDITYEEAFTVQPFNNIVTTQSFTGAQLLDVLKDQWCGAGQSSPTVLLPSASLTYTFDLSVAADILGDDCAGAANPVSDVRINGTALDPAATYRVTTNNFLADGGDGFASLRAGTNRTSLTDFDVDSLVRYLGANNPVAPPALDRIDVVP